MKRVTIAALSASLIGSVLPYPVVAVPTETAQSVDPVALDLARQIIDISSPPETRNADLKKQFDSLRTQTRSALAGRFNLQDPELQAIFDNHMQGMWAKLVTVTQRHMPALFDAMAEAYARKFSVAELREILAFAQTPAGKKFFQSGAAIMNDPAILAVNQRMYADLLTELPTLQTAMMADLEAKVTKPPS